MSKEHADRYDRSVKAEAQDSLSQIAAMVFPGSVVLDLGAATGALGRTLREDKRCTVDGVEIDEEAAAAARPWYRKMVSIDLEQELLARHFQTGQYDAIVCADVLEHLREPGKVLDQLAPLLAPEGRLLLSIPNIGYAGVIAGLMLGDFTYRPTGLLDDTHLRFFTRTSLLQLLQEHGFGAQAINAVMLDPHETEFSRTHFERLQPSVLAALLDGPDALVYQFIVEARRGPHADHLLRVARRPRMTFGVQIFWQVPDEPWSEARSIATTATMGTSRQSVTFRLPPDVPEKARIRLDLADRPGFLHLHDLRLCARSGEVLWRWNQDPRAFPALHDLVAFAAPAGTTWMATSNDPYLELPRVSGAPLGEASVALELSWPASSDHVFASSMISELDARSKLERNGILQKLSELQQELKGLSATVALQGVLERKHDELRAIVSETARRQLADSHRVASLMQRVTSIENAPGVRTALRSARRNLLRRTIAFDLLPGDQVRKVGDSWESTGTDPCFELSPRGTGFPGGWVRIHLELEAASWLFVTPPCLYVDCGEGFQQTAAILLPRPRQGKIEALVKLPLHVRAMRFDPLDRPGAFHVGAIRMQEVSKLEAGLRVLAPVVSDAAAGAPGRTAVRALLHDVRRGGVRGLKEGLRQRIQQPETGYSDWVRYFDTMTDDDARLIAQRVEAMKHRPVFSVVMPVFNAPERWLRRAIESVRSQFYPDWELCIADDLSTGRHVRKILEHYARIDSRIKVRFRPENGHISEASNTALELATGEFAALLDQDDELPPHALYMVAEEVNSYPDTDLIFSDEDKIDESGRRYEPYFKPDWDPCLLESQNYFSHLGVYRLSLLRAAGGFRKGFEGSQDYDLVLRCSERTDRIRHIAHVLYHWRSIPGSTATATTAKHYAQAAGERALREHFLRTSPEVAVEPGPHPTTYRARRSVPARPPLVSLVIPTRDGHEILKRCIDSIGKASYAPYETIIVDNDSREPASLAYLQQLRAAGQARVLSYPHPFNFSAINNHAAQEARGEVLVLLNNDVEAIGADWLSELVSQALRPGIGAVGAKLLYPDRTIQHAGVVTGIHGIAGHVHRYLPGDAPGYFGRAQMVQTMSVVTAACLAIRTSIYRQVGGMDAEHLAVAFNDVDFCLRVRAAGYRNLYTPFAELYHHESYTRGSDLAPEHVARFEREIAFMKSRWGKELDADPCYNPNLSLSSEQFELGWPTRSPKPWRPN